MSCVPLSGWPGITKTLDITRKLVCSVICFIPALLLGSMDFYHFIPLKLTLTLPGVTRSA